MGLENSEEKLGLDAQENRESLKVWGPELWNKSVCRR